MELQGEVSAAGHSPASALDIPEIGSAEGFRPYDGEGLLPHWPGWLHPALLRERICFLIAFS